MAQKFQLVSENKPTGDQPQAIEKLVAGIRTQRHDQLLLGVTGSGKTFTMANVIREVQKPALVMAHNKTLAAQLASEFRELFPKNAVDYFVSYYDYYQPEAYIAKSDTYIEKETTVNEEIDKYRHKATYDLLTRQDVIVVASVSAIYGLGSPQDYIELAVRVEKGQKIARDDFLRSMIAIQYRRDDFKFQRGSFRVRGDIVEVFPPMSDSAFRLEFWGDEIDAIQETDHLTGEILSEVEKVLFMPAKHAITSEDKIEEILPQIKDELDLRVAELRANGREIEAARLQQRTMYDIDMLRETGYVNGIENYTRYLSGMQPGQPPYNLLDFFPKAKNGRPDFLLFIDESHMTVPQIGAMYEGNLSRKKQLVEYGFRLPSAYDNRPLRWPEFEERMPDTIYVSATPGKYELGKCGVRGDLYEFLRNTGQENKPPLVVFMFGKPLSGKTTFSKEIVKRFPDFVWLSSDDIREEMFEGNSREEDNGKVFDELKKRMERFIDDGKNVIFDASNTVAEYRKRDVEFINSKGARLVFVEFRISGRELEKRRVKRNKTSKNKTAQITKESLNDWVLEPISPDEGQIFPVRLASIDQDKKNILEWMEGYFDKDGSEDSPVVQQIIRPTGLLDPQIEVRPINGQIDDLLEEIRLRIKRNERVLITTLTKKMAEELTDFLKENGLKVSYLHSEVETLDRIKILRDLRLGEIDMVVGINLLREGLDLPEVSLVAILDADKQGFLRSRDALLQTIGRTARNVEGRVIMYADKITDAMKQAIGETDRRRRTQEEYNEKHGITPQTIIKKITDLEFEKAEKLKEEKQKQDNYYKKLEPDKREAYIKELEALMDIAVQNMEFERAAELRDEIAQIVAGS